jgi:hypothetical protein
MLTVMIICTRIFIVPAFMGFAATAPGIMTTMTGSMVTSGIMSLTETVIGEQEAYCGQQSEKQSTFHKAIIKMN